MNVAKAKWLTMQTHHLRFQRECRRNLRYRLKTI